MQFCIYGKDSDGAAITSIKDFSDKTTIKDIKKYLKKWKENIETDETKIVEQSIQSVSIK